MRRQRGFNIIELIVVLLIMGILGVFAFPAMTKFLQAQSVRSAAYDLFSDLIYARSEAISRGVTVSLIANDASKLHQGWTIRENGTGTVIRTQASRGAGLEFTATQGTVTFDRSGRAQSAAEILFTIRPYDTTAQDHMKRCIRLDPSGRPRTNEGLCV
jgi:prepilin-type N-terminal cleavage/methylation domain-containing protein